MAAHMRREPEPIAVPPQIGRHDDVQHGDDEYRAHQDEKRAHVERVLEWQPVHVEAEIVVEVRICDAERHAIARGRQFHPRLGRQSQEQPQHHGGDRRDSGEIPAGQLLADLDVGEPAREHDRHNGLPHRVEIREHECRGRRRDRAGEQQPVDHLRRPDARGVHMRKPLIVNEQAGQDAAHEEHTRRP